jgi:hypothetical protein
VIFRELFYCSSGETQAHQQEDDARDFQPQLVEDSTEGAADRRYSFACGTHGAAAAGLFFGHARRYAQLSRGRDLSHGSILTAFGATMAQTCAGSNHLEGAGI